MPKALLFSPYSSSIGGGEVYFLRFAQNLEDNGYQIDLAIPNKSLIQKAQTHLGISLKNATINPTAHQLFTSKSSIFQKLNLTKEYDLTFFVSDGSIPFLFSKKNILHFQVPFTKLNRGVVTKLKLSTINHIVCNSDFTKNIISKQLSAKKTLTLYPPVNIQLPSKPVKKQNRILSVGRFTTTMHNKRQDVLLNAFQHMIDNGLTGWELVFLGSATEKEGQRLLRQLKKQSKNYPVKFLINASHQQLINAYQNSKIFWLSTGYDIDETKHPERVEHFGIVTVEAMSAGVVPIAINKGGPKEIINPGKDGYVFDTTDGLISHTQNLIKDSEKLSQLSKTAIQSSQRFSLSNFKQNITALL